jgi:hypothetical protein
MIQSGDFFDPLISLTSFVVVNPAESFAELRREVWLSSGLRHPNIVALKGT